MFERNTTQSTDLWHHGAQTGSSCWEWTFKDPMDHSQRLIHIGRFGCVHTQAYKQEISYCYRFFTLFAQLHPQLTHPLTGSLHPLYFFSSFHPWPQLRYSVVLSWLLNTHLWCFERSWTTKMASKLKPFSRGWGFIRWLCRSTPPFLEGDRIKAMPIDSFCSSLPVAMR